MGLLCKPKIFRDGISTADAFFSEKNEQNCFIIMYGNKVCVFTLNQIQTFVSETLLY